MSESSVQEVALPAVVDLDTLDSVRDRMIEAVEHGAVAVRCSDVERVATNGLLMLLCAAETAQRENNDFTITNLSEPMKSAIERLGLASKFSPLDRG